MLSLTDKVTFIQRAFGPYHISRDSRNVDVRCPICNPKDRSKLKLSILTADLNDLGEPVCLGAHCWTCGYRSKTLWNLLVKYGTQEQLLEYRDRFLPDVLKYRAFDDEGFDEQPRTLKLPDDFRLLATACNRDHEAMAVRSYLMGRNVSERDMWFYKVGCSGDPTWRRRAIVPSFDRDGELNLYVGRAIDKYRRPKYEMPPGDRKHVVFNELNVDWSKQVVLCEGPLDAMKCGDNAVPLLGSDLSSESALFNAIVANRTPIALAMDADMKTTKMPRLARKLLDYSIDVLIVQVPTDPGALTKQEFRDALAAAQPYNWDCVFLDRLDVATTMSLR